MPSFFEDIDSIGIAEANTQRLLGMQQEEGTRIIETYTRVREELRQRLAQWSGPGLKERFTAQRLRGTLLQAEKALEGWRGPLMEQMEESTQRASVLSINNLTEEIQTYDDYYTGAVTPINLDAMRIASEHQNFLIEQYSASFLNWNKATRSDIERGLLEALARQDTHEEVIGRLLKTFLGYEWQLRRIVRTEMHSIYNTSKIRGMQEARAKWVPDLMKSLYHPMDGRTADDSKALANLNPIVPINKPFTYIWVPPKSKKEYYRTFMAPPDRPNDRAVLIPYRPSWGAENAQEDRS